MLIVDESPAIREMVKECLESAGMLVFDFPDCPRALQWLEEKVCKPHVVLLDVDAPQEDWFPLVRHVRTHYADTVVVLLSCDKRTLARLQEQLTGVYDALIKPFLSQELLAIVQRSVRVAKVR